MIQETTITFNEPIGKDYVVYAEQLHTLAKEVGMSYSLTYQEFSNNWYGSVTDSVTENELETRDYMLSSTMELMIDHLTKIKNK